MTTELSIPESCGDFGVRIDRNGTWFHQGSPIGRLPLVKLFSTVLRREPDGRYFLVTPVERGEITVEDVPFLAVELRETSDGAGRLLSFRTNIDEWVPLDRDHPLRVDTVEPNAEPRPYITVRPGIEARLTRSVFYQLVDLGEEAETGTGFGVWSSGTFFPLGDTVG